MRELAPSCEFLVFPGVDVRRTYLTITDGLAGFSALSRHYHAQHAKKALIISTV